MATRDPSARTRRSDRVGIERPTDLIAQKVVQLDTDYQHLSRDLESYQASVNRRFDTLEKLIKEIYEKFNQKQQVSWPLVVSIVVGFVVLFSALHAVLTTPIHQRLTYLGIAIDKNNTAISELAQNVRRNSDFRSSAGQKIKEIETQFVAESHVRNLMHQKQELRLRLLAAKGGISLAALPDDDYYPIIGKTNELNLSGEGI